MFEVRKSKDRGHIQHGWLDTYHTFSFAEYYDPQYMGFRSLRVINEDRIAGGTGFPMHAHNDMEIVTYVLKGKLEHKDSMGNGSIINAGDVQRMSAGKGVSHSEFNPSRDDEVHLFQIWIVPEKKSLQPSYEQRSVSSEDKHNKFKLLVSPDARLNSLKVHQDAFLYASLLDAKKKVSFESNAKRYYWIQVASGVLLCNGTKLHHGDALKVSDVEKLDFEAVKNCEFLLFDLS